MKFEYKSNELKSMKEIKSETKLIKEKICEFFELDREQFRLQNGLITLQSYSKDIDSYINLTNIIGDFNKYFKNENFDNYRLVCYAEIKR